ncbi:MAG: hypothetical protein QM640_10640 [Niabella sp.]
MNTSVLKPVIAGIILGAALFFMPFFVLRVATVVLIAGTLFRLFAGRRFGRRFGTDNRFAGFADKIRNMSDEEYARFKEKFQYGCGRYNDMTATAAEK